MSIGEIEIAVHSPDLHTAKTVGLIYNDPVSPATPMGCIYKLTFPNGKAYIGMTIRKSPKRRYKDHKSNAKCGHNTILYNAWRKHGPPLLETIEEASNGPELYAAEIRLITEHNTIYPFGYNQLPGGNIPPMIALGGHSKATRSKISASLKGRPSPNKGNTASPETREKMRLSHLGKHSRTVSEAMKAHLSRINTGKIYGAETRAKLSAASTGRKHTQATKEKISTLKTGQKYKMNGYRHPPEILAKIAETRRLHGKYEVSQKLRDAVIESNRRRAKH